MTKAKVTRRSTASKKPAVPQKLEDLHDVGDKTIKDLNLIGITKLDDLKGKKASDLYDELHSKRPAVSKRSKYVMEAIVAQIEHPELPVEQKKWKYYSKKEKESVGGTSGSKRTRAKARAASPAEEEED